jgi:hypothetical protein
MTLQTFLIALTFVCLAIAGATSFVLVRRIREDRSRSEARVALLRDLAADRDDLRLRAEGPAETVDRPEIFHSEPEPSPWARRVAAAAAVAVFVMGLAWVWTALPDRTPVRTQTAAAATPLELLSLRHAVEDKTFVVTGLVQNPRSGSQLMGVEATVLLFDGRGTMLTSGRAPLDFTMLGAGDESPFLIRVPVTGAVARYRVGFRRADGQVLGHLDRRNLESIAQRQEP